jgi:cytochrome c-type biogenesis protein CcmH/NrfG
LATVLFAIVLCASQAHAQQLPPLEQARASYDAGRLDEARRVLEALAGQGTTDSGVFLLLGVVERSDGHLEKAIAALERAQRLQPDATQIDVELGVTLAWHRDFDRAIGLFQRVLAKEPGHAGARSGLGFALAWKGRLGEARRIFDAMLEQDPKSVAAWIGVGYIERASFHRAEAEDAYRRALELEPKNTEAADALEILRWTGRVDLRMLAGASTQPGSPALAEARVDVRYAIDQRSTVFAGYQRYGYGAASPIAGGGVLVNTRTEDSVEGGYVFHPSDRTTLAASVYTFFSDEVSHGTIWFEGAFAITPRLALIGNVRPAFSNQDPDWLTATAVGATASFTPRQQLTVRALIASNTTYEPRLTLLADYAATFSHRFKMRLASAYSGSDERYNFTSVAVGATYMVSPSIGVNAEAASRFETYERTSFLVGVLFRR